MPSITLGASLCSSEIILEVGVLQLQLVVPARKYDAFVADYGASANIGLSDEIFS